jgi:hypothetical protein
MRWSDRKKLPSFSWPFSARAQAVVGCSLTNAQFVGQFTLLQVGCSCKSISTRNWVSSKAWACLLATWGAVQVRVCEEKSLRTGYRYGQPAPAVLQAAGSACFVQL